MLCIGRLRHRTGEKGLKDRGSIAQAGTHQGQIVEDRDNSNTQAEGFRGESKTLSEEGGGQPKKVPRGLRDENRAPREWT